MGKKTVGIIALCLTPLLGLLMFGLIIGAFLLNAYILAKLLNRFS